ncbi:heterokaryon incompatibility protein-domain-containing protein [Phaeosphaeriaceae sp. PMI808]|nr:heterokaryon incompatibility protein-domain-containing protein [Phaeosphaeriaceae sp. PMI808]
MALSMQNLPCRSCAQILEKLPNLRSSTLKTAKNGIFISNVKAEDLSAGNKCKVCRLFSTVKLDLTTQSPTVHQIISGHEARPISLELRAFSFLQNCNGINANNITRQNKIPDAINLAVVPDRFESHADSEALKTLLWENGHLFYLRTLEQTETSINCRPISHHFDPSIVQQWLGYCEKNHQEFCSGNVKLPRLKLIDCNNYVIVPASPESQYLALSYIWGKSIHKMPSSKESGRYSSTLPSLLPDVIEDAITVTLALGFRYLWVDKYCIDQNNPAKHEELQLMDAIYRCSELTIVAAAGENESAGLPGVNATPRRTQPLMEHGNIRLISTMAHPQHSIKKSKWMTRGWTLQEGILARRRLVFTHEQVYFECNAMNCFESLQMPLDVLHTKNKSHYRAFMRAGLFTGRDEGREESVFGRPFGSFDDRNLPWSFHFRKYLILATNFTSRNLSFDSDSLNAFSGIMTSFETAKFSICQIKGLPYVNPSVFPKSTMHLDCFIAALCWRHIECCWTGHNPIKRREQFPSWTWAGWAGSVSWTDLFTSEVMDLHSLVDLFCCELQDDTVVDFYQYNSGHGTGSQREPDGLQFYAWEIPPEMISFHHSNGLTLWEISSYELELHISEFNAGPKEFLEALIEGRIKCILVAKGQYNSYFLFIEPQDGFARRIGVGEAWFYWKNSHCYRFFEEIKYPVTKKKVRLL